MKVLYIIGGSGKKYGSEVVAMSVLKELSLTNGVDFTVVTSKNGCVNELCRQLGIENYVIGMRFYVYYRGKNSLISAGKRIFRNVQADYATAYALKKLEKLVQLDSYDLIHTNLSRDLLGGVIKEKYNIPHIWHLQELYNGHYGLELLKKNQVAWMNKRADAYIAISRHVAKGWIEHGLEKNKVNVILNGIDWSGIQEKDWTKKRDLIKIIMVGELCEAKGQIYLIEAINKILKSDSGRVRYKIDFYGGGKEKYLDFIRKKIDEYKLKDCVDLKGHCGDIQKVLSNYDIAVNCSRGEGFGLATVEFMAAGLCVLAADTGANTEIIEDRINGIIFKYANAVEELSRMIYELSVMNDVMMKLGVRAREDVQKKYSLKEMCEQVFQLYSEGMFL